MQRVAAFLVPAASLFALVLCSASAVAQFTVVPYGSPGYRYMLTEDAFPVGIELPEFDDSNLHVGTAPFGDGNDVVGPGVFRCPSLIYQARTVWPLNTKLAARMHVMLTAPPAGAEIRLGIDDDVTIYVNGQLIGSGSDGCTHYNRISLPIPDGILRPGPNLVAALASDRGGASAFDMTLTVSELGPTAAAQSSWGQLKTIYR